MPSYDMGKFNTLSKKSLYTNEKLSFVFKNIFSKNIYLSKLIIVNVWMERALEVI